MKLNVFTVEEANRLLAEIRPRFERLVEAKREFDRIRTRMSVLGLATSGAGPDNPDVVDLRKLQERYNALAELISNGVSVIHRRGVLIKDLDQGLLDFYALHGDRLVFLCWKLGENDISHWHSLDTGYADRQPIDHSELE
ncbi:MAG: DUF2203 domain-containing protein [Candidatus Eisenbacteria bacterium]|uniref:DUF2203 domain-containing protein n=1 Tax=Eiseniibacteriota bacterium TaxID=2212470 RepID=A0A9D6LBC3_UNCEI|nr:DUF2203 domain-containing protein [Candidatus Eisenbacteria bacterium]